MSDPETRVSPVADSSIAPSQRLLALTSDEVRDRQQFVLPDEHHVAFRLVDRALRRAHDANQRTAVVSNDGPPRPLDERPPPRWLDRS